MTFGPCQMLPGHSAIDVKNDDGEVVATLYGNRGGIEMVCQSGTSIETLTLDQEARVHRLTIPLRTEPGEPTQD